MAQNKNTWITVTTLIVILLSGGMLYIDPFSFKIDLDDGSTFKYKEGVSKLYSGWNLVYSQEVKIEWYNGKGYTRMNKARGDKYSPLQYSLQGNIHLIRQNISYSKGILTRTFYVSQQGTVLKDESFFSPTDPNLRTRFRIVYSNLDQQDERTVFVDAKRVFSEERGDIDFGYSIDWGKDMDSISRVERFKNGKVSILTRPVTGLNHFDPFIFDKFN